MTQHFKLLQPTLSKQCKNSIKIDKFLTCTFIRSTFEQLLQESWCVYTLTDSERVYQRLYCRLTEVLNTVLVLSATQYKTTTKHITKQDLVMCDC